MHNPYAAPRAGLELPFAPAAEARLFSWNQRIGRVRFVAYCLLGFPAALLYGIAAVIVATMADVRTYLSANNWAAQMMGLSIVAVFLLAIVLATRRRLHDFGASSWWTLMLLLPIFQFIVLIYLLLAPGTPQANRFGAVPLPASLGLKVGVVLGCALLAGFTAIRSL